jgi:phage shock protein PspC (stress-responsive transcriptional regulator)
MEATRTCPYCAEEIRAEATRCRYCRSRLAEIDPGRWRRNHPERRLAGVAAAVAHALGVSVAAVRVGFIVLAFLHLIGPVLYGALWVVIPFAPGEPSLFEQGVAHAWALAERMRGRSRPSALTGGPPA